MDFSNPQELADHFIAAFYPYFTHRDENLLKFYSEDAIIMRVTANPIKFSKSDPKILYRIALYCKWGTTFSIASYQILPIQLNQGQGFQLLVTGVMKNSQSENRPFLHNFVLQQVQNRLFIVYDYFHYLSQNSKPSFPIPNPINNVYSLN